MIDVLIIEDERLIAERLKSLIISCEKDFKVVALLPSVDKAMEWFKDNSPPDLIFLDIQLNDGTGFDVIKNLDNSPPIIFTTAYHEYAMKAFKYNSIDYLLKPIDKNELENAIVKFKQLREEQPRVYDIDYEKMNKIINQEHKRRFLVKLGDQYQNIDVNDIRFFHFTEGTTYLIDVRGGKLPLDYSLDQLEELLNPFHFFRVNRQYFINIDAISKINSYFNSRLLLTLLPEAGEEVVVSRDRVPDFKRWMDC